MFTNVETNCSVIAMPPMSKVMPLCTYPSCILDHNNQGRTSPINYPPMTNAPNTQLLLLFFAPLDGASSSATATSTTSTTAAAAAAAAAIASTASTASTSTTTTTTTIPNVPNVPAFANGTRYHHQYRYDHDHNHYHNIPGHHYEMKESSEINEITLFSSQSDLAKGAHAKDRSTFPLLHTSFGTINTQYDSKNYSDISSTSRLLSPELKIQTQTQIQIQNQAFPFVNDKYCPSSPSLTATKSLKNRHQYSIRGQVAQKLQHVKPLANTNKPWKCPDCCKSYTTMDGLHSHFRVHTEWCFECKECGHRFARSRDLQEHVRVHTNERPYACQYCKKAFKQRHNLKDHERIHTRRDLFLCEICGKAFVAKHNMRNHRKSHLSNPGHTPPTE